MRAVPFVQREGLGVALGPDAVRVVEVVTFRGQATVRRFASEPVTEDGVQVALAHLVASLRLGGRFVHGHVAPEAAQVEVVRVPAFEDDEDVWSWLDGRAERAAPSGTPSGTRAAAGLLPEAAGDANPMDMLDVPAERVGAVATVPQAEVERALSVLQNAGLGVVRLATGLAEAATPLLASDDASRTEGAALLVAEADGATVVETSGGRVRAVHRVEGGPAVAVSEAQALGAGGRLVIAGPEAAPALAAASDVFGDAARLAHLPDGLASEYALAYGLAVEAAVPALEGVDLLAPETRAKAEVELEKQTGQRAVLTVALVLLAALALVESASWAFASGLDGAEAEALARADEIAAVEAARADVDRLQREIRSAQSSQSERTRQSVLLDRVGGSVPEGVWLASFAADAADLAITGYALDYGGVEQALAVLEVEPALTGVRLIRTTRLTGETTAGLTRPVVAFEVRADVRPGAL